MADIRKGMCKGCPWDYGQPATEMACNWGCLPTPYEAVEMSHRHGKAWACHDEPGKMCCGYAAEFKNNHDRELHTEEGIHFT